MADDPKPFDTWVKAYAADRAAAPKRADGYYWVRTPLTGYWKLPDAKPGWAATEWKIMEYCNEVGGWMVGDNTDDDLASNEVVGPLTPPSAEHG